MRQLIPKVIHYGLPHSDAIPSLAQFTPLLAGFAVAGLPFSLERSELTRRRRRPCE
jgi:hypothetical protein